MPRRDNFHSEEVQTIMVTLHFGLYAGRGGIANFVYIPLYSYR